MICGSRFRLIDSDGEPVVAVMAFLRELQASGRSAATQRAASRASTRRR